MSRTPKTIRTIGEKSFSWQHINKPSERELQYLEEHFGFDALDLHDCLPPLQRPKLIVRDSYVFLILNLPCFNTKEQRIFSSEVDIFLTKRAIITVSPDNESSLENFFELLDTNDVYRKSLLSQPGIFFEQLLDEMVDECYPKLLDISNDIELLSKNLLAGYSEETLAEIMRLKNNLIVFQKSVQPNRDIFKRIEPLIPQYLCINTKECPTMQRLISHTKEIWDNVDMYSRAIDSIQGVNMNLISLRVNDTLKKLTAYSIWLALVVAIAGIFSMQAPGSPFSGHETGFWKIIILMVAISIATLAWFKKLKWL